MLLHTHNLVLGANKTSWEKSTSWSQVWKSQFHFGCNVNSMHWGCTSNKAILKVLTATWLLKLSHISTWHLKSQTPVTCLKMIYFRFGMACDVIKHTVDAGDILCQPKPRLNPRCNFSLSFSCIVPFLLIGCGQEKKVQRVHRHGPHNCWQEWQSDFCCH